MICVLNLDLQQTHNNKIRLNDNLFFNCAHDMCFFWGGGASVIVKCKRNRLMIENKLMEIEE